jgi:hypothetical protein
LISSTSLKCSSAITRFANAVQSTKKSIPAQSVQGFSYTFSIQYQPDSFVSNFAFT